jgi:hypothetical protein
MNHKALLLLIRVACENYYRESYNDHTRKQILSGIYDLADVLQEDLESPEFQKLGDHARSEIQLIQDYAEAGLTGKYPIRDAIPRIVDCTDRAIPLPPDLE